MITGSQSGSNSVLAACMSEVNRDMNLFENDFRQDVNGPLAYRMRPVDLKDYVGQEHLVESRGRCAG